uniref:Hyaluronidase n=1 Tax=Lepisosteus oculatus TaxID=7918 RepID=W5NAU6_LEPOC
MSALLLLALGLLAPPGGALQPARVPLVPGQPFLVLWGIPDSLCEGRPDPSAFGMLSNGSAGQFVVFYRDGLGLYPYYDPQNQPVAGGLPQHTSLDMHLLKMDADVTSALPWPDYRGLAAIHWEDWAPLWGRNCGKKEIYREQSRSLLRQFFPDWAPAELDKWAQLPVFSQVQREGVQLSVAVVAPCWPRGPEGFLFPDCTDALLALCHYTGQSQRQSAVRQEPLQRKREERHCEIPARTPGRQSRSRHRVNRAAPHAYPLPEKKTTHPGPVIGDVNGSVCRVQADLVHTIGESAALGAAGAVVWEKFFSTKTQRGCWELADYVRGVLGPYVVNVTTAARLCGEGLCQGRGRCVR